MNSHFATKGFEEILVRSFLTFVNIQTEAQFFILDAQAEPCKVHTPTGFFGIFKEPLIRFLHIFIFLKLIVLEGFYMDMATLKI